MPASTEINPHDVEAALKSVHDQKTFLNDLLAETLNWPVTTGVDDAHEISYEWSEADLRARELSKKLIAGQVLQVQLTTDQPWGIFILEFASAEVFKTDRGMTGVLRQVLRGLVKNRNKPGSLPSWQRENLLFICTHAYEHFRIAHFKAPKEDGRTARLAAFGWGPDIPARTACTFNLNHLGWPSTTAGFEQWAEAFNVEKVTKKFYREYSDEFEALRKDVKGLGAGTEDQKMFTQTLLNRLMFLRFIERKRWLTPPGSPTGPDAHDYLKLLFAAGNYRGKSFYAGRLRKLFFEGLAVEGKQESESIGKVQFLNGGLFEETPLDEKVAEIPNEAFSALLGPDGLFYRYNFTVQESTPLDIEVAVDPEMLGKVFEELVTGRHESGSYYTPRPVVSFMCREAIKGYLTDVTKLPETTISAFVDKHDAHGIGIPAAQSLVTALNDLRAVDPACGSGAYLLGLLHEMVDLYRLLYSERLDHGDAQLHDLKLRIISNSIYGVDIDKFATNIAMLRLWLSLSVDSNEPLPLPNLEFKIETGDSVTGPCKTFGDTFQELSLYDLARKTIRLKEEHLQEHTPNKHKIKTEIDETRAAIRREVRRGAVTQDAIDWFAFFPEVFAEKPPLATLDGRFAFVNELPDAQRSLTENPVRGGFDIVLANPPYVKMGLIKALKPALRTNFPLVHTERADLYCYFYARAVELLSPRGNIAFISSNKWVRAGYGAGLRKFLADRCTITSITDFGELPVFETAATFPMIFVAKLGKSSLGTRFTQVPSLDAPYPDVLSLLNRDSILLGEASINGADWALATSDAAATLQKMRNAGPTLLEYTGGKIYYGIKSGFNTAFYIDALVRADLIKTSRSCARAIKKLVVGDDVRRWRVTETDKYLLYLPHGVDINGLEPILKHLKPFRERLESRATRQEWYELQQPQEKYARRFGEPKILFPDIGKESRFALDRTGAFINDTVFAIDSSELYLLGVLNSSPVWQYLKQTAAVLGDADRGGRLRLKFAYISQVPIPESSEKDHRYIGDRVQKCLDAAGVGCESWEKEIDERVAALYGI